MEEANIEELDNDDQGGEIDKGLARSSDNNVSSSSSEHKPEVEPVLPLLPEVVRLLGDTLIAWNKAEREAVEYI